MGSPVVYHRLREPKKGMVADGIVVRARLQMVLNTDLKPSRHTTARIPMRKVKDRSEEGQRKPI